jgi:putative colanic acid biosynthesis glycosyltransferase
VQVLHVNIRASQGGAGRVALDLHRRLRLQGLDSRLVYGYASGIGDDPDVRDDDTVQRIGTRAAVIGNFATHLLVGQDLFTGGKTILAGAIEASDVVHLHAPHHYFMNWGFFIRRIARSAKPLVITAHDWWFVTGRCGFVEGCTGWQRQCGECGAMKGRDLPTWFDFSRPNRGAKLRSIRQLGAAVSFACPSRHIARDYRRVYPDTDIRVVHNCIDLEFERQLAAAPPRAAGEGRAYLFSASDLASPGKVDADLVRALLEAGDVPLRFVGRNNPFAVEPGAWLGEVRSRRQMVEVLRGARALVFCSRMDNAPLTIMEALAAGCFVLAYQSPAAQEMLELVGGRCVADRQAMIEAIRGGTVEALYGGIDAGELARRAAAHFSGAAITSKYRALYADAIAAGSADAREGSGARPRGVLAETGAGLP